MLERKIKMPRLDDPNIKLKERKIFERPGLRPWDDPELFKPSYLKSVHHTGAIGEQKVSDTGAIGEQKVSDTGAIGEQISNQKVSKYNSYSKAIDAIKLLYGLQKKLLLYVAKDCKEQGKLYTKHITNYEIRILLNTSMDTVKNTVQRLVEKGIIKRKAAKKGKGGFTIFEIDENVRDAIIDIYNREAIGEQKGNQLVIDKVSYLNSSSSIDLNYNTTDYTNSTSETPLNLNLEPLVNIGLTENHINQLTKQGKLTPEQIQESINHFAFDLSHNDKAKTFKFAPLEVFMGILRKGSYYNAPSNYESQETKNKRLFLEDKLRKEQTSKELEERLKEVEWKNWSEKLTDQELLEFYVEDKPLDGVPDKVQKTLKRRNALTNAREYFESEVWLKQKRMIGDSNHA